MSGDNIQSVLLEHRQFPPPAAFAQRARLNAEGLARLRAEAEKDYVAFWGRMAREELAWHKPFTQTLDESKAPNYQWFADGQLNVSFNCLDRHLDQRSSKTAIIAEGEKGDVRKFSYRELHAEVC